MMFSRQAVLLWACICLTSAIKEEEIEYPAVKKDPSVHRNAVRSINFFSRGPEEDSPKTRGWRELRDHLKNVIQGGTVGLDVNLKKYLPKLKSLLEKVQKFLSRFRGFDRRSVEVPPFKPDNPPTSRKDDDFDFVGTGFINPRVKPDQNYLERLVIAENAID